MLIKLNFYDGLFYHDVCVCACIIDIDYVVIYFDRYLGAQIFSICVAVISR